MSIHDYLKSCTAQIEEALSHALDGWGHIPPRLQEAMLYSLQAGGKRIRPTLVVTAAAAVRGDCASAAHAMPVACAVEFIHTYSLIHDDLPAMDNDDYRRGKLTNHKVYGEAMAILAGDALLTYAFGLVARTARGGIVSSDVLLAIVEELSLLSGAAGMVGGQAADMLGEQGVTSIEELEYIHLHKTSDLIQFAVKAGGRLGGADQRQLDCLALYARNLGLAFQIQDDILDVIGDEGKLGKKTQGDVEQNKVTYPYLIGLEKSKAKVASLTREAKSAIASARLAEPDRLLQIADYLLRRDH
ncbi:polyprenyl synthetase family protein [Paenibacillus chungangensis]|uniref:Polyprenyl synthetase family protein n=1 Tax=Paenibacillus chungangensis TaxID=696535 RepID=A0ABW3HMH6_9BACL